MISTVTTSTITTVTTVTTMIGFGLALGLVAIIALVAFLCAKELTAAGGSRTSRFLARSLDVGIVPLAIAFSIIVVMKVVEVLA